ncbi:COG0494 NTP pyrophosphohydrolases including oxidative damage repair enzymes [Vibrio sp. B1FLJ16]|uniref:bifunctional NUDIX hydrolase/phosphatase PAP2 family protein n=1 Tax=Vibrio sp. B1FLJ16 TaxID=2751178 RepID=UPI0015F3AF68|nr:bifunctional NUDIX hydrolase/phosphatase PAP2 family protein [Vibrio sp. B1FLJ16]CAD7805364.1 COG0494 NTP pyrophosphohydrolases including oxidative damage repair enzymes [Vibrio sp. B1FLJ16]CAE6899553.1 COG0494 NTP pyrophosphohydrolases including oxidative damage repair enzymes [Vibrio sp. B1FLJ16]
MLRQLFFLILCSVMLAVSTVSFAEPTSEEDELYGALCVVRADDKIVLVHEILTDKISLPGGSIGEGESPQAAAQRETWEETGLVVTVGKELGRMFKAVFYDCVSDSEIIAFSTINAMGGNELPVWFAPHYGVETASAMLLQPKMLPSSLYRYPEEWPVIVGYFDQLSLQPVHYVNQLIDSAPSFRQLELEWMTGLQSWVGSISEHSFQTVHQFAALTLELIAPTILLFLFPFVLMRFDSRFIFRLFFAISATSIMALVAQQGFSLPRPHVYVPMVELTHSFGYSFPSLPIAVWSCVFMFLFHRTGSFGFNSTTGAAALLTVMVILSKFFLGSAFILDMLLGALLGILVAWHVLRLEENPEINVDQLLTSKGVWFAMTAITVAISVIWPLPVFACWLAVLITASVLVLAFDNSQVQINTRQMIFVTLVLVLAHQLYLYFASLVSSDSLWSLIFTALHYPLLMLLCFMTVRRLTQDQWQQREVQEVE